MPEPDKVLLSLSDKSLSDWQIYLQEHFQVLRSTRINRHNSVFALEHNLSSAEFDAVRLKLLSQTLSERTIREQWLLWVVYATDQGYNYIGEEYWQSFNINTP